MAERKSRKDIAASLEKMWDDKTNELKAWELRKLKNRAERSDRAFFAAILTFARQIRAIEDRVLMIAHEFSEERLDGAASDDQT